MARFLAFALTTLLLALPALASAQTTATSGSDVATCAEPGAASGSTPAVSSSDGSVPGATPVSSTGSDAGTSSGDGAVTPVSGSGDVPISGTVPVANTAQEPEPEPGEPQPPTGDEPVEVPAEEAPPTGGGLPRTGLEALKLALLGFVLLLVGARVRAITRRRRARGTLGADGLPGPTPEVSAFHTPSHEEETVPDETQEYSYAQAEDTRPRREVWSFPDPREPAPTGLLPSTAMARRRALERDDIAPVRASPDPRARRERLTER